MYNERSEGPVVETSNARGGIVDRELAVKIAQAAAYSSHHMHDYLPRTVDGASNWQPHEWVIEAIQAGSLDAATPPAAARGGVRGLVAKWQKELSGLAFLPAGLSWYERGVINGRKIAADELEAALAAEGEICETDLREVAVTQAGEVEQRARVETALRDALAYVGQRTDGDLTALAERAELWMRESQSLIQNPVAKPEALFTEKNGIDLRGVEVGQVLTEDQWEAVCAFVREQDSLIDRLQGEIELQPEARGVVDEAMVERIIARAERETNIDGMDGDRWDRILVRAALTGERNG